MEVQAIIMMGVSGSGKTTVGQQVAALLGWHFYDADDFHPQANVDKMESGVPLTDADRWPWLNQLHALLVEGITEKRPLVLACSALKQSYRDVLMNRLEDKVVLVYLQGSFDLIWQRIEARTDHYMKADMLESQFADLEEPTEDVLIVDVQREVVEIVSEIVGAVGSASS